MGCNFINFDIDPGLITWIKRHTLQLGEKIDAIGWQPELDQ